MSARKIVILLVAAALVGAGVYLLMLRKPVVRAGCCAQFNILFVTLDTTRADRLGFYGYKEGHTPNLDALAGSSFVFENAVSPAPLTVPSHASMMTGRVPSVHGIRDNAGFSLDEKETTLAEVYKQAGYATAAFVSSFVLDSSWKLD